MTTNQPDAMTDLAAKIESALDEHAFVPEHRGAEGGRCKACHPPELRSMMSRGVHRAHLARDVIAPLVEAHGREAAAAALVSDEQIVDEVSQRMADRANARLAGRYPPQHIIKQELRDDIAYALKPYLDRAAQHRSKP